MSWSRTVLVVGLCFSIATCLPSDPVERFDGHQVFDITTEHEVHKNILGDLVEEHQLDVWRYPKSYGETMSVRVRPEYINRVLDSLQKHGLHYKINIRDLQALIDEERKSMTTRPKRAANFDRNKYHGVDDINAFLHTLGSQCAMCSVENIGKSYESRDMLVLKISDGKVKPGIFIDGGIHAREWISPATVINILYAIATDPSLSILIEWFDWHFLPLANPDGYEFSRTTNRMWRKTCSLNGACNGTDPNRNFDYWWGHIGSSSNPCSDIYRGSVAFSEIETRNLRDYVDRHKNLLSAYLTFHSFGQYFLYPWGYQGCVTGSPSDEAELRALATSASDAIFSSNGGLKSRYTIGTSGCALYPAAGGSDDWAKGAAGIKFSYTVELPDGGRYGFLLPESEIEKVGIETTEGMIAFADHLHRGV